MRKKTHQTASLKVRTPLTIWPHWAALNFSAKKYDEALDALSRRRSWIREILKFKITSRHAQSQGLARAGGNGVAQGDPTRPQLRAGAQHLAVIYISQLPPW